jgi:hypothetical protein
MPPPPPLAMNNTQQQVAKLLVAINLQRQEMESMLFHLGLTEISARVLTNNGITSLNCLRVLTP